MRTNDLGGHSMAQNPFTPTFGKSPAVLAGRDQLIQEMELALEAGDGDPNLCSLFSGPRGVGKTVLLSYLASRAEAFGWVSVNVTARPGMLEDIIERATEAADEFVERSTSPRLTAFTVSGLFGATWQYRDPSTGNWRTRMNKLLNTLAEHEIGLLITIDELDPGLEELVDFAATYQHFVREDRRVALFMAGLPINVSTLLSNRSVSFLRRAAQHPLGRIDDYDVREAFRVTIADAGKRIDEDALDLAVAATDGFAYMMQLVGFRTWNVSGSEALIVRSHVERGSELAVQTFVNGVVKKTCQELSDGDLAFLEAMLPDGEEPSKMADIAERMGKSASYARVYRSRLLEQGVIDAPRRGYVEFSLPLLRDYLTDAE